MNKQQPLRSAGHRSDAPRRSGEALRTRGSQLPEIAPGTFDAAALLASVTESLRPVIDSQLEQISASLATSVSAAEGTDVAAAIRTELARRLVPQFTEAVRGAVMDGMRARQMHLAQLAAIDRTARQTSKLPALRARIDHEITKAGLVRVVEPDDLTLFSLVNPDHDLPGGSEAAVFSVTSPAYTDRESGRLVEAGWLRADPEGQQTRLTPRQKRQAHPSRIPRPPAPAAPAKAEGRAKKSPRKGLPARPQPLPPANQETPGPRPARSRSEAGNQQTGRHQKGTP
ncbi:hypothetical protein ABT093_17285 [Kitasatospora sp. NPDC002551]|uniref:hypothetical protein n=1 Tax=Kitasatospora sp. NPDC002551 TaxID=3154539 RepID=UPI00331AC877